MVEVNDNPCSWVELVVTGLGGGVIKKQWVHTNDYQTKDCWRQKYKDKNLFFSAACFYSPEKSAKCTASMYFVLRARSLDDIREPTIKTCLYISDNFSIPQDCIEVIYAGGSNGTDAGAAGSAANNGGESGNNTHNAKSAAAETVILIPPIVFTGQPTPLMPAINYELARQLVEDVTENIDIDVYHRSYLIKLPNSFSPKTGSYVIPLTIKELLYMAAQAIAELSKQPRPEDSLIMPCSVPEAAEWFGRLLEETKKTQERQHQLQNLLFKDGWQTSPCTRRLLWADLDKNNALEACRIISQFYSWIKASPDEIWHYLQQINRRNRIEDYQRLRAILNFATENPRFANCEHPLLKQFCPAGKCFMAELNSEYECPSLFQ